MFQVAQSDLEDEEAVFAHGDAHGDKKKEKNFRITRIYDMLSRIMAGKESQNPLQKERVELYRGLIAEQIEKIGTAH